MTAPPAFAEQRPALLAAATAARAALDELAGFAARADGPYARRLAQHILHHERSLHAARQRYIEALPRLPLARCPFTGAEVDHSFDPLGLDGLWWDYERPARPAVERVPHTWFAMTGAVALSEPVEETAFLVRPGPAAPAVLPRLLQHDGVRAVITQLALPRHTAFAVTYFTEHTAGLDPVDTWGASDYRLATEAGDAIWCEAPVADSEFDFDLAPWVERGRLWWLAPDDPTLTLHNTTDGCPYLALPGIRATQHLQGGVVWTAATAETSRSQT